MAVSQPHISDSVLKHMLASSPCDSWDRLQPLPATLNHTRLTLDGVKRQSINQTP